MTLKIADGYKTTRLLTSTETAGPEGPEHAIHVVSSLDEAAVDAFGLQQVASPYTIFESKLISGKSPLLWDEVLIGGATSVHVPVDSLVGLTVATGGDAVIRQTRMRFNYQAGKSQKIKITGLLGSGVAGTVARFGYFNSSTVPPFDTELSGIWFEADAGGVAVCIGKGATYRKVYQQDWNVDKLTGVNGSKRFIDFSKAQIFFIDFAWLALGQVRMGVQAGGQAYFCHTFSHVNELVSSYMSSPNHSLRYELRSSGGSTTVKQICAAVESGGGLDPSGVVYSIDNGIAGVAAGTTLQNLLAFRLRDTCLCTTVINETVNVMTSTVGNFRWQLALNPAITGTLAFTPVADTALEVAVGNGSQTVSGGLIVASGYTSNGISVADFSLRTVVHPGVSLAGVKDVLSLAVQTLTPPNETFFGAVSIRELTNG